jgi:hypothetical protein
MRDDLLDAQAGIDWANAQLKILEGRIEAWRQLPPYELIEELHPYNGEKVYKLANVRSLPQIINVEAGLIINSLRSTLDVLANILAARNGFPNSKDTQFPVCRSRDAFFLGKHAGHKDIKRLSTADQKIIKNLEPWAGGHPHLFELHTLDNVRKHRKLIDAYVMPVQMTVTRLDGESGFQFADMREGFRIYGVWKGFEDDAIVGWTVIDAPKPDLNISLIVTLSEGHPFPTEPIFSVLDKFASATQAVVDLFA